MGQASFSCRVATIPLAQAKSLVIWRRTERAIARWMDQWQAPIGVYVGSDTVGRLVAQGKKRGHDSLGKEKGERKGVRTL